MLVVSLHELSAFTLSAITLQYEEYRAFLAHKIDRTVVDQKAVVTPPPKTQPEIDPWEDLN